MYLSLAGTSLSLDKFLNISFNRTLELAWISKSVELLLDLLKHVTAKNHALNLNKPQKCG